MERERNKEIAGKGAEERDRHRSAGQSGSETVAGRAVPPSPCLAADVQSHIYAEASGVLQCSLLVTVSGSGLTGVSS